MYVCVCALPPFDYMYIKACLYVFALHTYVSIIEPPQKHRFV